MRDTLLNRISFSLHLLMKIYSMSNIKQPFFRIAFLCFIATLWCRPAFAQLSEISQDSIFVTYQQLKSKEASLLKIDQWRQETKTDIEQKALALDPQVKAVFISDAEKVLKQQWPVLTASEFLEFTRNGNRSNFEKKYKVRRDMLKKLLVGELLEKKGRFLPMIADGVWMICEESTWALPATMDVDQRGFGLPEVYNPVVDLCVAQTAILLGWTKFFFNKELNQLNSKLIPRIDHELNVRAVQPYLSHNDFWWMGFTGRKPNNWNIYCNYYVLMTALTAVENSQLREEIIVKSMKSVEYFLASYADDGGCDEGPNYWNMAGGTFGIYLKALHEITGKKLDFSNRPKIHQMGTYLYKVHIDSNYFVNFADAPPRSNPDPAKIYAFGEMFNDDRLKSFAASFFQRTWAKQKTMQADEINVFLQNLQISDVMLKTKAQEPLEKSNWLPDLQVLTLRQQQGTNAGLLFAAKGGHNAESHNHNDVGNFILYQDGKPVIIDVGIGTYTRDTFNEQRWSIWNIRSLWHNCPTVNGLEQQNGEQYRATNVGYAEKGQTGYFLLDIASAYPASAGVEKLVRNFEFQRKQAKLVLTENYQLKTWQKPYELNFITALRTSQPKAGVLRFQQSTTGKTIEMQFDPNGFDLEIETKTQEDPKLVALWGNKVYRIALKSKSKSVSGNHVITFATR
ncbi:MAG: hypothetical protein EOO88_22175 [Pedobacter sp.]|nr:MAG: hypothetical protein EOO88_22175 [Pedobacter sp.]